LIYSDVGVVPSTLNNGILEEWNNGQKHVGSEFGFSLLGSIPIVGKAIQFANCDSFSFSSVRV